MIEQANETKERDEKKRVVEEMGCYVSTPFGSSMMPMLRGGRDNILVTKPEGPLKVNDVVLYARKNGTHVLHRIIRIEDGKYSIRGDNCDYTEHGITEEDLIGVMTGFWRKNKFYSPESKPYKVYIALNRFFYPIRYCRIKVFRGIRRIGSKIPFLRRIWHKIRKNDR